MRWHSSSRYLWCLLCFWRWLSEQTPRAGSGLCSSWHSGRSHCVNARGHSERWQVATLVPRWQTRGEICPEKRWDGSQTPLVHKGPPSPELPSRVKEEAGWLSHRPESLRCVSLRRLPGQALREAGRLCVIHRAFPLLHLGDGIGGPRGRGRRLIGTTGRLCFKRGGNRCTPCSLLIRRRLRTVFRQLPGLVIVCY